MHYLVFALGIALSILAFAIFKRKRKNNEVVDMVLISLLITVILELLTFNYSTYCYYGDDYATKTFTEANGGMTVSKQNNSCAITINNVNTKIRNFYIDYTGTPDKANNINVSFSDEASTNTDAKDKGQVVVPKEEITKYVKISPAGKVGTLTINLGKLKNPDGSDINGNANTFNNITVSINKRIPIFLSIWRMLAVFALLFLIQLIVKYKYLRWGDIKPGKRK